MKFLTSNTSILVPVIAIMTLAACSAETPMPETDMAEMEPMATTDGNVQSVDHNEQPADQMMPALPENTGYGVGEIRSIGDLKDSLTIAHGPIKGIGMGAMTMGFDIVGDVDLSSFSNGEKVAFIVKKGRDNSYRISEICRTQSDGTDCLSIF